MRKLSILIVLAVLLIASNALAAGTVTQATTQIAENMYKVVFTCTGDASDGSIPDTDTTDGRINGFYSYRVIINNTTAQTDTSDDADVYIKDAGGIDLMNGQGVDQLDADTCNYVRLCRHDPISGPLTLDVNNQSQTSAVYTVTLILGK